MEKNLFLCFLSVWSQGRGVQREDYDEDYFSIILSIFRKNYKVRESNIVSVVEDGDGLYKAVEFRGGVYSFLYFLLILKVQNQIVVKKEDLKLKYTEAKL